MRKSFLVGCKPFIVLDGCHLKGLYGSKLLCAIGGDPNDQMYPLAFAIVEVECKASWTWL